MDNQDRGPGRIPRVENRLTPEQRQVLGVDQFFTIEDLARILGISEIAIRNAIDRGTLSARLVPRPGARRKILQVKGWRAIIWRDVLAGTSDGDEDSFERPG